MHTMSMKTKLFAALAAAALLASVTAGPAHADTSDLVVGGGAGLRVDTDNGAPDAVIGNFSDVTLSGAPQLSSASITPFTIIDDRGTWAGWHVNVSVGNFSDGSGHSIAADTVVMDAPIVVGSAGSDASTFTTNGGTDFTGVGGVKVISAPATSASAGTFLVSPLPLRVTVPQDTFAATYHSTTDVALATLP
jgi:hypothetical protein